MHATAFATMPRMLEAYLVPNGTKITAKGNGPVVEIGSAACRLFLLVLEVLEHVEQEAIDLSVFGSADGTTWGAKPLAVFPQQFYPGQYPLLLDLQGVADLKFLQARWEVSRWGRGSETPMFTACLKITEVDPEILR